MYFLKKTNRISPLKSHIFIFINITVLISQVTKYKKIHLFLISEYFKEHEQNSFSTFKDPIPMIIYWCVYYTLCE